MKKRTLLLCTSCITVFLLQLASCVKPPKDFDPRDGNAVFDGCRIKHITYTVGDKVEVDFVYNSKNDPVSVTPSNITTGTTQKVFYYDKKGKLVRMIEFYEDGDRYEAIHSYGYTKDLITTDSSYSIGQLSVPGSQFGTSINYLKYDKFDRIITDSLVVLTPHPLIHVFQYSYDANGNRQTGGIPYAYDNKLNLHRTNKIWMFIDRDYSVNNPFPATGYTYYGLPQGFSNPGTEDFIPFLYFNITNSTIQYDCK